LEIILNEDVKPQDLKTHWLVFLPAVS